MTTGIPSNTTADILIYRIADDEQQALEITHHYIPTSGGLSHLSIVSIQPRLACCYRVPLAGRQV